MADELDDVPLSPTRPTAESTLVLDGTQKFRTRPLALVYSAKEDRKQFENRLNDWRLELSENINKPQKEWSQPWRPQTICAGATFHSIQKCSASGRFLCSRIPTALASFIRRGSSLR